MAKQKIHSTTQDFTEVVEIAEDAVILKGRNACALLEVSSVNFFLLSGDEQNARIYGYMSMINSLSFPIQIVIVSKRIDMGAYLKLIEGRIANTQNPRISEHLSMYKEFLQELIKGEGLLDKKIYIVIPFSPLEIGPLSMAKNQTGKNQQADFNQKLREVLASKRATIMSQVERMGLTSRVVAGEELAKLFYELFNEESVNVDYNQSDIKNIIM